MNKGICPLLRIASIGSEANGPALCLGSLCAWWDCLSRDCCMAAIADCIRGAVETKEAVDCRKEKPPR